ncbi:MAG: ABC transporter permease [Pseudopedobacter saltans]|uniref:ABC transporter permease n=1 Tax=Pseudopedobacter saltans TaxID=151895 RepID=A0A2W5EWC9_9SPHI|nr:MAG: ABC transporter permease [Pseudopedobacter saltans]
MRVLPFLLYKEFMQILRNKIMFWVILLMPAFQLLVMPMALSFEQKNISLSVVDHDHSTLTRDLVRKITSSGYFELTSYPSTYTQAMKGMDNRKTDLILEIPSKFESDLIRQQKPKLSLTIDALNGMKGSITLSYFSQILQSYNVDIATQYASVGGITTKPFFWYNDFMSYERFMVPGILVILISMMGGLLSASNIVREKEIGTIEQINVTPVPKLYFILGKMIPFWIIGLLMLTIGIPIAGLVYDLYPDGNYLNIYLYSFLFLLSFSGFGIIISNYSESQQQSILTLFFFFILFILFSGFFTPISSMPHWAQTLTLFNPLRYFVEAMRMLFLKNSSLANLQTNLLWLLGFGIVFNVGAVLSYKKTN